MHPSILPADFDITASGELVLNLPPSPVDSYQNGFDNEANGNNQVFNASANANAVSNKPPQEHHHHDGGGHFIVEERLKQIVESAAQGRELKYIRLYKPEGKSLGFSVVGLRSEHKGELGIYVQEIQPHGIAGTDGQLLEGDQILAIDGQPLDSHIQHKDAIKILQVARGTVDLIVARNYPEDVEPEEAPQPTSVKAKDEDPGVPSDYCQVEEIELVNNGSGLGFGIIGGQKAGVIVKTILPDGVADRDGRLRPNDYILQINEHWLHGVGSEQVAVVLRGTGNHVRLVVARPVDPTDPSVSRSHVPIVSSAMLTNRNELERFLQQYKGKNDSWKNYVVNLFMLISTTKFYYCQNEICFHIVPKQHCVS